MNLLDKYRRYKVGNSYGDTNQIEIDLFNAEFSDEQWQIIDKLERKITKNLYFWCLISGLYGVMVGVGCLLVFILS